MTDVTFLPTLVEQVYARILTEICDGTLPPNSRLIQDELAAAYNVSRQPIQQALMLLRARGFVTDGPKRGVVVAPLDVDFMKGVYEVRQILDGLASRLAAERAPEIAREQGWAFIDRGLKAIKSGSIGSQIAEDISFHQFIYSISGNLTIEETARPHWHYLRRIMGEVLRVERDISKNIWDEHVEILEAIIAGDGRLAERLAEEHIERAAGKFIVHLQAMKERENEASRRRTVGRHQQRRARIGD